MGPAKDRQAATDRFWQDVETLLTGEYHHPPWMAQDGIRTYRDAVRRHNLGEVVFNQGEEQAAKVIHGVIEHGLPVDNRA